MRLHIDPSTCQKYGISLIGESSVRSSCKLNSLAAVKEKLILAYTSLLHEANRSPYSVGISCAFHSCEEALLLLTELEPEVRHAKRSSSSLAGATQPIKALEKLYKARQEILDRHLINKATEGETYWFTPEHWDRLRSIRPDLAPAAAGDN
jgi:hypothetical protein